METTNGQYQLEAQANYNSLRQAVLAVLDRLTQEEAATKMQEYASYRKEQNPQNSSSIALEAEVSEDSQQFTKALTSLELEASTNALGLSVLQRFYFSEIPLRYRGI